MTHAPTAPTALVLITATTTEIMAEAIGGDGLSARDRTGVTGARPDAGLEVVPWQRYGHDRLYVNTAQGDRVGWVDLRTGERHLEQEHHRAAFDAVVAVHGGASTREAFVTSTVQEGGEEPAAPSERDRPWADLAANRAGEGAAMQAKARFAEAPVRSIAARLLRVHTDERAWRLGAKGEALVGKQLANLDPAWRVLHSVPVGRRGSDIDHVVIGPGGVFTINAKHHPEKEIWVHRNTFIVGSTRTRYVHASRYEADRAQRLLTDAVGFPVPVVGLIAVIGAHKGFTVKEQPLDGRVIVLKRRELAQWLGRLEPTLELSQVETVFEAARRSTTWRDSGLR